MLGPCSRGLLDSLWDLEELMRGVLGAFVALLGASWGLLGPLVGPLVGRSITLEGFDFSGARELRAF
eukprot:3584880-Pyramimonas_sp.AAC.1